MRKLAALLALAVAVTAQPPVFTSDVKLVRLLVTVKDQRDELVGSLEKKDFIVVDCGAPQDIAVFERQTAQAVSVQLLIDISGSTAKDLRYEQTSIGKFLSALFREGNQKDAVSLYSFNYDVMLLSDFTRNQNRLNEKLKAVRPEGGTSLYDAIHLASRQLSRRDGRHRWRQHYQRAEVQGRVRIRAPRRRHDFRDPGGPHHQRRRPQSGW
jgi:Ca-activated chloride channel family protein